MYVSPKRWYLPTFCPEDGDNMVLRKVGIYTISPSSQPWELQSSHNVYKWNLWNPVAAWSAVTFKTALKRLPTVIPATTTSPPPLDSAQCPHTEATTQRIERTRQRTGWFVARLSLFILQAICCFHSSLTVTSQCSGNPCYRSSLRGSVFMCHHLQVSLHNMARDVLM